TLYGGFIEDYIKSNMPSSISPSQKIKNLSSFIVDQGLARQKLDVPLKIQNLSQHLHTQEQKISLAQTLLRQMQKNAKPDAPKSSALSEALDQDQMIAQLSAEAIEKMP